MAADAKKYRNPIIETDQSGRTSDPYVIQYEGKYYFCYSYMGNQVCIERSDTLWDVGKGEKIVAYTSDEIHSWFAPELHRVDGAWYIYGAPQVNEEGSHRMAVLENKSQDPFGPYEYKGLMEGLGDRFGIDGTVLEYGEQRYFIWTTCREMLIAKMDTPLSICGEKTVLSRPELAFETRASKINEGPAILRRGEKIFLVYSANDSKTDEYCLGMIEFLGGAPLDSNNWKKRDKAVFEKSDGIYGPGHCSFTTVEGEDYIVYHANLEPGTGWRGRSVWLGKIQWDANGDPDFGKPEF